MDEPEDDNVIRISCGLEVAIDRFALVKDIVGYILFHYNQIPLPLDLLDQHVVESTVVEEDEEAAPNPRQRRHTLAKARAAVREARKLEKQKRNVQIFISALKAALDDIQDVHSLLLILGSSLNRPVAVYEIQFLRKLSAPQLNGSAAMGINFKSGNATKNVSKKITRALVSADCGSPFTGPMKLFQLIKTDSTSKMPQEFVPKRGFTPPVKKIQPILIQLTLESAATMSMNICEPQDDVSSSNDAIWFQCRFNIRGGQFVCRT